MEAEKRSSKVTRQTEAVIYALRQFPDGAYIEQIKMAAGIAMHLRTLQRRLADLKKTGLVSTYGIGRSTRYWLTRPDIFPKVSEPEPRYKTARDAISLSEKGKEIRSYTLLPEQRRKPVGYNRAFLESYRPNTDSYLTKSEMEKLAEAGKTEREHQPAGTYAREILNRLLIDLSWNSSRLEGNTYSLLDTERLILQGQLADDKSAMEAQMILNHKDAIEFIVQGANDIGFNRYTLLNLHALLSNNLLPVSAASGRLRSFGVGIHKSVFTPLAMPHLIEEMFDLLLKKAAQIQNPFEQAFFIMVHVPYLQPFDDVNKRVSRLAANISLTRYNLAPLSFIDVPNDLYVQGMLGVYELTRIDLLKDIFLWAYERSSFRYAAVRQSIGEPDTFRLKYREPMRSLVTEIVSQALSRKEAKRLIDTRATEIPEIERPRFIEIVETELLSLHEGNIARYWVAPAEFRRWKTAWG